MKNLLVNILLFIAPVNGYAGEIVPDTFIVKLSQIFMGADGVRRTYEWGQHMGYSTYDEAANHCRSLNAQLPSSDDVIGLVLAAGGRTSRDKEHYSVGAATFYKYVTSATAYSSAAGFTFLDSLDDFVDDQLYWVTDGAPLYMKYNHGGTKYDPLASLTLTWIPIATEASWLKSERNHFRCIRKRWESTKPSPSFVIEKNTDGSPKKLNFDQATQYCAKKGKRLPTAYEFVLMSVSLGAKGLLPFYGNGKCSDTNTFYIKVSNGNASYLPCYSPEGYRGTEDGSLKEQFWTLPPNPRLKSGVMFGGHNGQFNSTSKESLLAFACMN